MNYWQDKVVVVTGGSSGLGLALSKALVRHGARVVMAARDEERLEAAASEIRNPDAKDNVTTVVADVTLDDQVRNLIEKTLYKYGDPHAFFHCAGVSDRGEALATSLERYEELFRLNFLAAVRCAQAVVVPSRQSPRHLVLIGSLASKIASRYLGAYPTSKFPLAAFAQQLRLENGPQGLHVLLVCPGPIARADAGRRYDEQASSLPESARRPGGGVKLKGIDPGWLAEKILSACVKHRSELIVPAKARLLCAIAQLSPNLGDWLVRRFT